MNNLHKYYKEMVGSENPVIINSLGLIYKKNGNLGEAYEMFEKSSKLGFTPAMNNLGKIHIENDNEKDAIKWYTQSADLNDAEAAYFLGNLAMDKFNEEANSVGNWAIDSKYEKEAYLWYMKSVSFNSNILYREKGRVALDIGSILLNNTTEKLTWCLPSANKGDSLSLNNVGFIYQEDDDEEKAIEYFTKSANLKNSIAMYNLGKIYISKPWGNNSEEAYNWIVKSANLGYIDAIKHISNEMIEDLSDNLYNILIEIKIPKIKAKLLENRLKKNIDIQELINIFISYNKIQNSNNYLSDIQLSNVQKYIILNEFEQYIPISIKPLRMIIMEYLV